MADVRRARRLGTASREAIGMEDAPAFAEGVRRHVAKQHLDRTARHAHTVASTSRRRGPLIGSCVRSTASGTVVSTSRALT